MFAKKETTVLVMVDEFAGVLLDTYLASLESHRKPAYGMDNGPQREPR